MNLEHDFDFEFEPRPAPESAPAASPEEASPVSSSDEAAPKPVVVIQYQRQGWGRALLPPLLILAIAVPIVTYLRPQSPFRPALAPQACRPRLPPRRPPGPGRIITVEPSGVGVAFEPIIIRSESSTEPAPGPNPTSVPSATSRLGRDACPTPPPVQTAESLFDLSTPPPPAQAENPPPAWARDYHRSA